MFIVNFFKFLFLFFIGYLIYSFIKFIIFLFREGMRSKDTRPGAGNEKMKRKSDDKIIELDKDQYKVE
jgi:hypothetical protein